MLLNCALEFTLKIQAMNYTLMGNYHIKCLCHSLTKFVIFFVGVVLFNQKLLKTERETENYQMSRNLQAAELR